MKGFALSKVKLENNPVKKIVNKEFARIVAGKNLPVIILDGPGMKTYKALVKAGFNPNNIHIPNASDDYKNIRKKHPKTYPITLNKFLMINRNNKKKIGGIYMDYMCTVGGNDECRPTMDLTILFNNKMMAKKSVLAITLASRTGKGVKKRIFKHSDMLVMVALIYAIALANHYVALLEDKFSGVYKNGGPMFTLFFRLY